MLLGLLASLLALYFLKYVPSQRADFHRRAFLELNQINTAFQERNDAFIGVIQNFKDTIRAADTPGYLAQFFRWKYYTKKNTKSSEPLSFRQISFEHNDLTDNWQISYMLAGAEKNDTAQASLSINLDSILHPIVSTYSDIFTDYLLIQDTVADNNIASNFFPTKIPKKGVVLFNSSSTPVDYHVKLDTLLKKTDGFSLENVHDVTIQGNPYKLFLYPVHLRNERVIIAGLISKERYAQGAETIPINLIAVGCILLLLLLLNLPLLKIYILGPLERITSLDIRMIICAFFLAAFMIFFLSSFFFLGHTRTEGDQRLLDSLGNRIQDKFKAEIGDVCRQLEHYDTLYAIMPQLNNDDVSALSRFLQDSSNAADPQLYHSYKKYFSSAGFGRTLFLNPKSRKPPKPDSADFAINALFHPYIYPRMNLVFWIDSNGEWLARWAFENKFADLPSINVKNRQYFIDVHNNDLFTLPKIQSQKPKLKCSSPDSVYAFAIQPTLSRIDGAYDVTIVIRSNYENIHNSLLKTANSQSGKPHQKTTSPKPPEMLGISTEMYSVSNTIMPPGYGFSIIDNSGQILYDSRPGRSLLSNLFTEAGDNTDLQQCVRYRYKRYFDGFNLKGRQVALMSKPMKDLSYTLIVYSNVSFNEGFQFHSLGLACFSMAVILLLIALIALLNEWSRRKPTLLAIWPEVFKWLHPVPDKMKYYSHIRIWMLYLLGIYLVSWLFIEYLLHEDMEPSLFTLSLAFPFFIALHYYFIREKYYLLHDIPVSSPPPPSSWKQFKTLVKAHFCVPLGTILTAIFIYSISKSTSGWQVFINSILYAIFLFTIGMSAWRFNKTNARSDQTKPQPPDDLIRRYASTILVGIPVICMIPVTGLFMLFFKEENNRERQIVKLNMARMVEARRRNIDSSMNSIFFSTAVDSIRQKAKFESGIYFLGNTQIKQESRDTASFEPFDGYSDLHQLLFTLDSTTLEPQGKALDNAYDSSWELFRNKHNGYTLLYRNIGLNSDPLGIYLIDTATRATALHVFGSKLCTLSPYTIILFFIALVVVGYSAYRLTISLTRHIFLLDVLYKYYIAICVFENPDQAGEIGEVNISAIQLVLEDTYNNLWQSLSTEEKYILYDFALDGFTNYKSGTILYRLLRKKVVRITPELRLAPASKSFHNYLLNKDIFNKGDMNDKDDLEVFTFMKKVRKQGSWQAFRVPLHILLAAGGLFIFLTQDALYQKVIGLVTSVPAMAQMVLNIFERNKNGGDKGSTN